jgi:hypothetical protein
MHFVDENLERKFYVLTTKPMLEAHTGTLISDALKELITDFDIPREKVQIIMRDAASSWT